MRQHILRYLSWRLLAVDSPDRDFFSSRAIFGFQCCHAITPSYARRNILLKLLLFAEKHVSLGLISIIMLFQFISQVPMEKA
ncbi:uncharacterized protein BO95DRAFT_110923 [Aspergillus brunneoviolaceus CBS 621.78]|uniref:Uncharacterized protein n=1 Tax=Aspergillus brunneoviolaceus CBS 621.78 TaxID=1450534 RepID=A0ACD1GB07_9EURO|nr:hypothetical protein BO95DRAFT_110923 [Aspergillus brunneoviolaceus CBS 621.78]RAH46390.1 hypothetical protein BO95DRAFT_110923 [Aspergillus brunneoviolaceus CBS 621.78]